MPQPARQPEDRKVHQVWWEAEDWQRILRAAEVLRGQQEMTLNVTAADVIRNGTLRFVDEVLNQPAKAS